MSSAPIPAAAKTSPASVRKVEPLKQDSFKESEFVSHTYVAIAARGVTPDDILDRGYWAHVSQRQLRPTDRVVVWADDKSWVAEVVVLANYSTGAEVAFIIEPKFFHGVAALPKQGDAYEVFDGGLGKKWCVRRLSDARTIKGDGTLTTKEEADAWLLEYLKGLSARAA